MHFDPWNPRNIMEEITIGHIADLAAYTTAGQMAIILAATLARLQHGPTRQECFDLIKSNRWLDLHPEDLRPYPSSMTHEPRWQTLLSWARGNLAKAGLIDRAVKNSWTPTRECLNTFVVMRGAFREHILDVRQCYLWSPTFKKLIDPNCSPSEADAPRPEYLYEDDLPKWRPSFRGSSRDERMKAFYDMICDLDLSSTTRVLSR